MSRQTEIPSIDVGPQRANLIIPNRFGRQTDDDGVLGEPSACSKFPGP
ncbi:MAG: hypothetical protein HS126_25070 [Anaerolineales bacterium]|nr:hypothetical protein [Anaerolineales bacterium]